MLVLTFLLGCLLGDLWSVLALRVRDMERANELCTISSKEIQDNSNVRLFIWKLLMKCSVSMLTVQISAALLEKGIQSRQDMAAWTSELLESHTNDVLLISSASAIKSFLLCGRRDLFVSDSAWECLQFVAKSRRNGITPAALGKLVNADGRNIFFYLKNLISGNMVVKVVGCVDGLVSNVLYHTRYAPSHEIKDIDTEDELDVDDDDIDVANENENALLVLRDAEQGVKLRQRVVTTLASALNRTMSYTDLKDAMQPFITGRKKKFFVHLLHTCRKDGNIERVHVKSESGKLILCLRYLKDVSVSAATKTPVDSEKLSEAYVMRDHTVQYQVLRIIGNAPKDVGISTTQICRASHGRITPKCIERVLIELTNVKSPYFNLKKKPVQSGRQRSYLYSAVLHPLFTLARAGQMDLNMVSDASNSDEHPTPVQPEVKLLGPKDNATLATRRIHLANFLKEEQVLEIGRPLAIRFRDKFEVAGGLLMDIRTLRGLVRDLEITKQCRVMTTQNRRPSGVYDFRSYMICMELDLTGPGVREKIRELQKPKPIVSASAKRQVVDYEIEQRLPEPTRVPSEQVVNRQDPTQTQTYWRNVAQDFGWILPRFARCRFFHQFLMGITARENSREFIISGEIIAQKMTLQVYLKVIGHTCASEALKAYIDSGLDTDVTLIDLPEELSCELFKNCGRRIRLQPLQLIPVLECLKLITKTATATGGEESNLPDYFQTYAVESIVPVRDYSDKGTPLIKSIKVNDEESIDEYWDELESSSILRPQPNTKALTELNAARSRPLHFINLATNWRATFKLSIEQKVIMDAHFNSVTGETPYSDTKKCSIIAEQCNLTVLQVRAYFRKILTQKQLPIPEITPTPTVPKTAAPKLANASKTSKASQKLKDRQRSEAVKAEAIRSGNASNVKIMDTIQAHSFIDFSTPITSHDFFQYATKLSSSFDNFSVPQMCVPPLPLFRERKRVSATIAPLQDPKHQVKDPQVGENSKIGLASNASLSNVGGIAAHTAPVPKRMFAFRCFSNVFSFELKNYQDCEKSCSQRCCRRNGTGAQNKVAKYYCLDSRRRR